MMADASASAPQRRPPSAETTQKNRALQAAKLFQGRAPSLEAALQIDAYLQAILPLRTVAGQPEERTSMTALGRSALVGRLLGALDPATAAPHRLRLVPWGSEQHDQLPAQLEAANAAVAQLEADLGVHRAKLNRHQQLATHLCRRVNAHSLLGQLEQVDVRLLTTPVIDRHLVQDSLMEAPKAGRPPTQYTGAYNIKAWNKKAENLMSQWDEQAMGMGCTNAASLVVKHSCADIRCNRFKEVLSEAQQAPPLVQAVSKPVLEQQHEELVCKDCISPEQALHATLKCSISNRKWEKALQILKKTRVWPGKTTVAQVSSEMNAQMDEWFGINDALPDGWTGATVDVESALLGHLLKYEAEHPSMARKLRRMKHINVRYSLDGTNVDQQGNRKMVVVVAVMDLPGISVQSSAACVPIAILESDENRHMFIKGLDRCIQYISQTSAGKDIQFHGAKQLKWKQSYDLSAWWKMLSLSGIMGEGDYCPFCECDRSNDFDFNTWRDIEIGAAWREGVDSVLKLSPLASGFCVLHAKLRVIGDTLKDKIMLLAQSNKTLKQVGEYLQQHISPSFKVQVTKVSKRDGTTSTKIDSSSLLGNRCDEFVSLEHFPIICGLAGLTNEEQRVQDCNDGRTEQCRARLDSGCRLVTANCKLNPGNQIQAQPRCLSASYFATKFLFKIYSAA